MPAASSTRVSLAATPSFIRPASVTTKGRVTPRSASSPGSLSSACAPHTILVGQLNSNAFTASPLKRRYDSAADEDWGERYAARQPKNSFSSAVNR